MTYTRLKNEEIALLRDRLTKGHHIDKALLAKAAAEYLRLLDLVNAITDQIKESARKAGAP